MTIVLTQEQALSIESTKMSDEDQRRKSPVAVQDLLTCVVATLVPLRPQPGIHCLWPARRSIACFCFARRLPCAATERDGLRVGTTVIEPSGSAFVVEESHFVYATLFLTVWTPRGPLFHRVWQDRQLGPCVTGTARRLFLVFPFLHACCTFSDDEVSFGRIDQK